MSRLRLVLWASVSVLYTAAQFARGLGFSSISSNGSCAPDACLGREIFGARLAILYAVIILRTTSPAIGVSDGVLLV